MSRDTSRDTAPIDLGRLVGLVGPGAWALYVAYAATYAVLACLTASLWPSAGLVLLVLGVVLAAGAIVASPSPTPLPLWRVGIVWAAVALSTALGSAVFPAEGIPALEAWFLGANSFLLFAVALRGRILGAWLGMAIMVAVVVGWGALATGDGWHGLAIVYGQAVSLLAGTFFSLGLHTTARRIAEYQVGEERAAAAEAHEAEARRHRRTEMETLRRITEPTLLAIAEGRLTTEDRHEVEILEATLRDRIRGRALAEEPLASAVLDLRRRGADVLLLDDLGGALTRSDELRGLRRWAATALGELEASDTTLRITREDDRSVLTITTETVDLRRES